eukprot:TRINITY_DN79092_c0_g1_i1.p1 TRINITY_DN79092_c0_g1~~TRINITY_DN79092_c0_g1_i1.p1  ORF type:complete len:350 (+),score=90.01 TRINITY_DN79092_c0_g1_i1:57-1106(+)
MAVVTGGDGPLEPISPASSSGVPRAPLRGQLAAEVDTEIEDNGAAEDEEYDKTLLLADEVEEELELDPASADARSGYPATPSAPSSQAPQATGDYVMPEQNKEVWKQFGCDTEAGRMLRKLYKGVGVKEAASKVSYPRLPSPARRWEPAPRAKPAAPKAVVRVPRAAVPRRDMDDPRQWPAPPIPCRRPAREILAELEADQARLRVAGAPRDLPRGRDQDVEKQGLQDRFQYCGGRMMPKGSMGHVSAGSLPPSGMAAKAAAMREDRKKLDENGFNAEQREIFEELISGVRRKQARVAEIDEADRLDPKPSKAKTALNKEALELRNAIDRDLRDIDKLLELTESLNAPA